MATTALSPEQRARLCGVEYLLGEVAPLLGAAKQQALARALLRSGHAYLTDGCVESTLRQRPWSRAAPGYSVAETRHALDAALIALQLATLEDALVWSDILHRLGRQYGAKRWQAYRVLQCWCGYRPPP